MKVSAGVALVAAAIAALSAGTGYWIGTRANGKNGGAEVAAAGSSGAQKERKVLYYRNPMGLPDTSPVPKKDPMGMDYIAVYEGEQDSEPASANQIRISTDKVQKLGVRTERAQERTLDRVVRAAGRVEPDERRIYTISPKFEGYVERLFANVTGQAVSKGQPLFEVYSPELVSAQREYAIAAQGVDALKGADNQAQAGMKELAQSSLVRLRNWDISDEQIKTLAKSGDVKRTLTFRSPVNGIVTEKKALQGMRFMPGDALYQVADLSSIWILADVFEQDVGLVRNGAPASLRINAYPGREFKGRVTYVYPTLKSETRTIPVRVELPNPGLLLKPSMYADVEIPVSRKAAVVTVPGSAVIDSGLRRIVLVQLGEGRFEPREVKLGERGTDYVEILEGVKAGEEVVVAANFLIDAESNLKAAIGGFGHSGHGGSSADASASPAGSVSSAAGHKGEGTIESLDPKSGTVSIAHQPIASLRWPAMTMEFKVANPSLLKNLQPGSPVTFEFVERQAGEWVITALNRQPGAAAKAPASHSGHQ